MPTVGSMFLACFLIEMSFQLLFITMNDSTNRNGLSCSDAGKLGYLSSIQKNQEMKRRRIDEYNCHPRSCKKCEIVLPYEKRTAMFCSHSCSSAFNNTRKSTIVIKKCLNCKFEYKPNKGLRGKLSKFCSPKCGFSFKKKEMDKLIETGNYKGNGNETVRKYLIKKYGAKCMICKWDKINPTSNKCPIVLNHIDGNSKNWNLENLNLICPNCDSLTSTYKSLNKGNGRFHRRQRYKEGKSF